MNFRGKILFKLGKIDDGIASYDQAISIDP
ncbi:tetratricopeptide repeat protein [Staphylococcus nepalensis]